MIIYTIEKGDTLYEIAKRLGADAQLIARDNEIVNPDVLTVGQSLVIRTPQTLHTVSEGENIYTVAQNYGVSTNQLWRNNPNLGGEVALRAGEMLVVSDAPPIYGRMVAANAYVYPSVNREVLRRTLPYLTYLTLFSYGVEDDGELSEIDDTPIIELARQYGVAPIMTVSNLTPEGNYSPEISERILSSRSLQDILIGEILRTVAEKRYSGVNVDFEYVPARYADEYSAFLERLDEKLGSGGYPLWVSLAPKSEDAQSGMLYEGHNYEALGRAADKSVLQTYGWGNMYGEAMAIAPMDKVREVAEYAKGRIEPSRLFLGTPNYGYDWSVPFVNGTRATPIGNKEATELAADRKATIEYDTAAQAPSFGYFTREDGSTQERKVWFQDARSVESVMKLIDELGLYGVSVWNAMKYFPQLWLVLNGAYNIEKILS